MEYHHGTKDGYDELREMWEEQCELVQINKIYNDYNKRNKNNTMSFFSFILFFHHVICSFPSSISHTVNVKLEPKVVTTRNL